MLRHWIEAIVFFYIKGPSNNIDVHHNQNNVQKGMGKGLVEILLWPKKIENLSCLLLPEIFFWKHLGGL
jgi:hypothetical protein